MPNLSRARSRRWNAWLATLALAMLPAVGCGDEQPSLDQFCEEEPPPSYGPGYGVVRKPDDQNPTEITYRWVCVEGDLVEETFVRSEGGCWTKFDEYRRQNLNCPQHDGDSEAGGNGA